jgi:hypothetical protein
MLTALETKQSRWVYEGGELEQDSKNPRAITVCEGTTRIVVRGCLRLNCPIATAMTATKVSLCRLSVFLTVPLCS